jgi:hypothetical protein
MENLSEQRLITGDTYYSMASRGPHIIDRYLIRSVTQDMLAIEVRISQAMGVEPVKTGTSNMN